MEPGYILAADQVGDRRMQFRVDLPPVMDGIAHAQDRSRHRKYIGQWHHFAGTYGKNYVVLYIDGVQISKISHDGRQLVHSPVDLCIGHGGPGGPSELFRGIIDEVRLWNVERTQQQIQNNMRKSLTGDEAGLVAYWKLDEGKGTIAHDSTKNHNDGTLHGLKYARQWGPEQATGAPDTHSAGDIPTAWASLTPDGQDEWLVLEYEEAIIPRRIDIHETFNPGAVSRVTVFSQGTKIRKEVEVWKGEDPTPQGSGRGVSQIPVNIDFKTKEVKIYLDSHKVNGWNEIDAIALVDESENIQWAKSATASSTYAEIVHRDVYFGPGQVNVDNARTTKGRAWGPEQATGQPDTHQAGDISTAWATLETDRGEEWLELDYDPTMRANMVRIHETFNPGAVTGIILKDSDGNKITNVTVTDTTTQAPAFLEISFPVTERPVKTVRVLLNTSKVRGWNEIDAVELVGPDNRGWALNARASSTYAVRTSRSRRSRTSRVTTPTRRRGRGRSWGPEHATGVPDTHRTGDIPTAWASLTPDGQDEWLMLEYEKAILPRRIDIYETFNPGAVSRITFFREDSGETEEIEVWRGVDPTAVGSGRGVSQIPVELAYKINKVKIYLDSRRVKGWNEIDAVGIVDSSGQVHWAKSATASSTYAERGGYRRTTRAADTPENVKAASNQDSLAPNTTQTGYVDDTAEGKRSLGGSGHAVIFECPEAPRYIEAVQICASRYGTSTPPNEDFHLYVLNEKQQVLADLNYAYAMIERGTLQWYTLSTPSIEVPKRFYIALSFNPHRTKGIYLGLDKNVEQSHSLIGLPDSGFVEVKEPYDWMIRVFLTEQPSGKRGMKKLVDFRPP
ncbi:MAG: LamG domain-containing protein [Planctomycetota bacterium]|jgi:hypothetical protein